MNKDNTKNFVGQPILSQILRCIPKQTISDATVKYNGNRYYKKIPVRVHVVSLLYGVLTYCNGLRELCEGLLACEGKLAHLGLEKAPPRSTLSDANRLRNWKIFEHMYFDLVKRYHSFISDSRLKGLSIRNLKIIDSTTIRLFSDLLQGVGRNPNDGSRKKGGIKVHALMDAFSGVTEFARITAAKAHDRSFLLHLKLAPLSYVVFDKAYNHYAQFAYWTAKKVWFVTRMKENAVFHVTKVIFDKTKRVRAKGVIKVQLITLGYRDAEGEKQRLILRRITFKTDDGKIYVFITNNLSITAEEVANIYKHRWMIELLFKQIKQNFPIRYFWGENENAIRIQVYCVLIAQLLMVVIRKKSATKKSFANIITIVRLHLMSYVELLEFIKDTYRTWRKSIRPPITQLNLI